MLYNTILKLYLPSLCSGYLLPLLIFFILIIELYMKLNTQTEVSDFSHSLGSMFFAYCLKDVQNIPYVSILSTLWISITYYAKRIILKDHLSIRPQMKWFLFDIFLSHQRNTGDTCTNIAISMTILIATTKYLM